MAVFRGEPARRFKYACPQCHEGAIAAIAPPQAVEKSLAGEGLLAHVVVSKYVDHLPLYRLSRILLRERVDVSRATLCGWAADVAAALTPIGDQLRREITAARYLHTDDTPVTILDERHGRIKGRLWTYLDPLARQVVFDATATHERDGPEAFLATFHGDLHADAYTGYDALYATGRIREIGCWAHTRRGFVEALTTDVRAALMVALIQQLYQVERAGTSVKLCQTYQCRSITYGDPSVEACRSARTEPRAAGADLGNRERSRRTARTNPRGHSQVHCSQHAGPRTRRARATQRRPIAALDLTPAERATLTLRHWLP